MGSDKEDEVLDYSQENGGAIDSLTADMTKASLVDAADDEEPSDQEGEQSPLFSR